MPALKRGLTLSAAVLLATATLGYGLSLTLGSAKPVASQALASKPAAQPSDGWIAAAPGRVEPRNGEVRVGTPIQGRIFKVWVPVQAVVELDEILVQLDDDEARARLAAAEAEAGARKQERDRLPPTPGSEEVRRTEDAVYAAERGVMGARFDLDRAQGSRREGEATEQTVAAERRNLEAARARLQKEQRAYAAARAKPGVPAPSRAESMVSAGRADVAMAEALLDKTRIRAPAAGTVLQQNARLGEIVAPSPEAPLVVVGDVSSMRVKAEVDEADVVKIRIGQRAFVRSQSYPGREFEGTVARIAPTLAPPRIGQRGPRRPTDVEVIEVTVNLEGKVPLLTGMRVDAFFKR